MGNIKTFVMIEKISSPYNYLSHLGAWQLNKFSSRALLLLLLCRVLDWGRLDPGGLRELLQHRGNLRPALHHLVPTE